MKPFFFLSFFLPTHSLSLFRVVAVLCGGVRQQPTDGNEVRLAAFRDHRVRVVLLGLVLGQQLHGRHELRARAGNQAIPDLQVACLHQRHLLGAAEEGMRRRGLHEAALAAEAARGGGDLCVVRITCVAL